MKSTVTLRSIGVIIFVMVAMLAFGCSQAAAPTPTAAKPASDPAAAPTKAAAPAAAPAKPAEKIVIKAASNAMMLPGGLEKQTSDAAIAWIIFDRELKKLTDRVDLQMFHGNQLGDEQAMIQGARLGVPAPMASGNVNNLHPYAPSIGFAALPYMWKSEEEVVSVMNKIWDELDERIIKEAGVRVIAHYPGGFRDLTNSKKPIKTIDDLKGMKIRVPPTPITLATYKAWGVEPVPIAYAELYQALQQKVVDAHDLPAGSHFSGKFFETQKYYTPLKYCNTISHIVIGEKFFQGLPKDVQDALTKAGRETLKYSAMETKRANDEALKALLAQGLELSPLTDEAEWEKRARAIWPQFYAMAGGKGLVDRAEELKKSQ